MPKKDTKTSSGKKKMQDQDKVKVFVSLTDATEAIEDVIGHIIGYETQGYVNFDDYEASFGPVVANNVQYKGKTYPVATAISDGSTVDFRFYEQENPTSETVPNLQKSVHVSTSHHVSLPITDETPKPSIVRPNS